MSKRLYVTSLVQANNCSHQYKLKVSGFEPKPPDTGLLAGILFENAAKIYLPRTEISAKEAVLAANENNLPENILNFVEFALEKLPDELKTAETADFSVFAERELGGFMLAGYVDLVADGAIYELKYTQKYINEPQKAHIFQLQHYMYLLDRDEATIVYACNTKKPAVLAFKVRRWSEHKYFALIRGLANRYYEDAPLGLIHDWLCDYCAFSHVCEYKNEQNEVYLSYDSTK